MLVKIQPSNLAVFRLASSNPKTSRLVTPASRLRLIIFPEGWVMARLLLFCARGDGLILLPEQQRFEQLCQQVISMPIN
jgi:hypothetical protein